MTHFALARSAQSSWETLSVDERVSRLMPALDYLERELESIASTIHQENGKPVVEAIAHEIMPGVAYLKWLESKASGILSPETRSLAWLPHRSCSIRHRPYGVTLVIAPWNIPFFIPFSQTISALAAGNAVVLKPSEVTPRCGQIIQDVLASADLPRHLFTLVQGDGSVGAKLIKDRPDKVLFTGSVKTGRKVMAACAKHPIPVGLELGGIDAAIVLEDANLDYASSAIAWGANFNHGQICASVERLLVHRSVHDELVARVADKMERINVRDDLGRVTFEGQKVVLNRHLADAEALGLKTNCGGAWLNENQLKPTLYSGDKVSESKVWVEESFGPMLAALGFTDDDEAIELHNATRYGLTASIFSQDLERATRIAERLSAGNVSINDLGALHYSQPELPWGGTGESGFGRSHGPEGLLNATWPQVIDRNKFGASEPKRPWWYPYDHHLTGAMSAFTHLVAARDPKGRVTWLGQSAIGMLKLLTTSGRN